MAFNITGPSSISVEQGKTATATISVGATSKSLRNVILSLGSLPPGLTGNLTPSTGKPSFQAKLTLAASASAAVGTWPIQIKARDARGSKILAMSVTVIFAYGGGGGGGQPFTADVWVAKTSDGGNDSNNGLSEATPKLTISAGLSVLNGLGGGRKMAIKNGTYAETIAESQIPNGSAGDPTEIVAYPGHTVTVNGSGGGQVLGMGATSPAEVAYITFDGINFTSSGVRDVVAISGNVHHVILKNLTCTNSSPSAGQKQGIILNYNGSGDKVHHCEFWNVTVHSIGVDSEQSHGWYVTGQNNLFDGCLAYNNADRGIQLYSSDIPTSSPDDNIIRNSTFRNNGRGISTGPGITIYGQRNQIYNNFVYDNNYGIGNSGGSTKIYNNTVYSNNNDGISNDSGTSTVRNNIAYANGTNLILNGGSWTENNNTTTDPSFVDESGRDLRITSSSSAKDNGVDLSGEGFSTDFFGTARPQGAGWSRGAHEV